LGQNPFNAKVEILNNESGNGFCMKELNTEQEKKFSSLSMK